MNLSVGRKIDRKSCRQLCQESGGFGFKLFSLTHIIFKVYDTILIDGIIFYLIQVKTVPVSNGIDKNRNYGRSKYFTHTIETNDRIFPRTFFTKV